MVLGKRVALVAGAVLAASGLGYGVGLSQGYQPHMQNALGDLQAAQNELQVAARNKGGHRATALNFIHRAITEVEAGMACGAGDC
jgi:hypothetical protein